MNRFSEGQKRGKSPAESFDWIIRFTPLELC